MKPICCICIVTRVWHVLYSSTLFTYNDITLKSSLTCFSITDMYILFTYTPTLENYFCHMPKRSTTNQFKPNHKQGKKQLVNSCIMNDHMYLKYMTQWNIGKWNQGCWAIWQIFSPLLSCSPCTSSTVHFIYSTLHLQYSFNSTALSNNVLYDWLPAVSTSLSEINCIFISLIGVYGTPGGFGDYTVSVELHIKGPPLKKLSHDWHMTDKKI